MRRTGLALALVLAAGLAAAPATAARAEPLDAEAALREGNRRFRQGRLEAAAAAYRRGLGPGEVDPVLAYNLGTALHRLGRLPEALLWYRRARAAGSTDPWLAENLERARGDLAAVRLDPPVPLGPLLRHPWRFRALATLLAWAGLVAALLARPRPASRAAAGVLLAAALALWSGTELLRRLGPRPAVLLAECARDLPAGSEVWVARAATGGYRVSGSEDGCPADAVGLVETVAAAGEP